MWLASVKTERDSAADGALAHPTTGGQHGDRVRAGGDLGTHGPGGTGVRVQGDDHETNEESRIEGLLNCMMSSFITKRPMNSR